jgi:bacillithiol biosynthesis deacetylase BshB1
MEKLDILAFGAHPDDVELSCSGTLIREVRQGKRVGVVDLTMGELGTRGSAEIRMKEAALAAEIMGLSYRQNLGLSDGFFEENQDSLQKIIQQIRYCQPDIVIANAIQDRHPDHARGSNLVSRACFLAGLSKIESTFQGEKQRAWRPKVVYHYIQDRYIQPDVVVDISDVVEEKKKAILAYATQFYNPDSKEPDTPISSPDFFEYIFAKDRIFGRQIHVTFAEGFTAERAVGTSLLTHLL